MDITKFIVSGRDKALLVGDYETYRGQLTRRILTARKRLGRTTKKGAKYTRKAAITAEDVAGNHEFAHLLVLIAERAWAHAMLMKSAHSVDAKGITGATRSHIISRLAKASTYADNLFEITKDQATTGSSENDVLESRAYAAYIHGTVEFEKQSWEACVRKYSEAWVIYTALGNASKSETFKDLLSTTIEPSIRYGAYQMGIPRTVGEPTIARKYFPREDTDIIEKLDPSILKETSKSKVDVVATESTPRHITWRSRKVALEDASIGMALDAVSSEAVKLLQTLTTKVDAHPRERAAAYDDILIKSQDVVDATRHAIDELTAEGIGQGDKRMQSLQITRTAVSYDMISWRIGRNRVLTGEKDGAMLHSAQLAKSRHAKFTTVTKEPGNGRKLASLREKAVLYDATLQSLDSIKELPGVAADGEFIRELDAKKSYFRALKCLSIARSHALLSNHKNSLALLARAAIIYDDSAISLLTSLDEAISGPPNVSISSSQAQKFQDILAGELQRERALLDLSSLVSITGKEKGSQQSSPLVDKLGEYPLEGVNLKSLVAYPPKMDAIPVKPLFFDVAWNYVQYPERSVQPASARTDNSLPIRDGNVEEVGTAQQRRGWFGFGRS